LVGSDFQPCLDQLERLTQILAKCSHDNWMQGGIYKALIQEQNILDHMTVSLGLFVAIEVVQRMRLNRVSKPTCMSRSCSPSTDQE